MNQYEPLSSTNKSPDLTAVLMKNTNNWLFILFQKFMKAFICMLGLPFIVVDSLEDR